MSQSPTPPPRRRPLTRIALAMLSHRHGDPTSPRKRGEVNPRLQFCEKNSRANTSESQHRVSTRSPDEPPVARMRGRWRHPGAVPQVAALMRATDVLAEMAEVKKKRPTSSYAIALPAGGGIGLQAESLIGRVAFRLLGGHPRHHDRGLRRQANFSRRLQGTSDVRIFGAAVEDNQFHAVRALHLISVFHSRGSFHESLTALRANTLDFIVHENLQNRLVPWPA